MDVEQLNPVDLNLINDLWVPNVFIYNLKTFKVGLVILISVMPSGLALAFVDLM